MFTVITLQFYSRYHTGSLAFGALILSIVQFIRIILEYLDHKLKGMNHIWIFSSSVMVSDVSICYSFHKHIKKTVSTTIIIRNGFWAPNQHVRKFSENSCDTGVMMLKIQLGHHRNKLHFKRYLYFSSNKWSLNEHKRLLSKTFFLKSYPPNLLNSSVYIV